MKILFISTIDNVGGAALVAWNLGKELAKQGHNVKYIVGFKKSDQDNVYQLKKFFLINYLTEKTGIDFNFISRSLITKFLANDIDFGAEEEILNHPWYKEADIIHCNNLHGNFFKLETFTEMTKEKKIIWTLHDEWAIMASGSCVLDDCSIKNGLYERKVLNSYPAMLWNNQRYLGRRKSQIYNKSQFVLAVPSLWLKKMVKESILGSKDVRLIHNGIDSNVFKPHNKEASRKELGLPLNKRIITFIADSGKKNSWKGWAYAEKVIEHFKYDDSLFFLCIGGAHAVDNRYGNNVKFIKYTKSSSQLAKYYSSSNLLIFPSIVESFGLVAVEAMSCGIPVVSFPVGVITELIEHEKDGYIAKFGDVNDFIDGVLYMLYKTEKDPDRVSEMLSRKTSKDFSLEMMTRKYFDLYKEMLK